MSQSEEVASDTSVKVKTVAVSKEEIQRSRSNSAIMFSHLSTLKRSTMLAKEKSASSSAGI